VGRQLDAVVVQRSIIRIVVVAGCDLDAGD
jgi:hypothetical protein